jgi:HSP20 family protein
MRPVAADLPLAADLPPLATSPRKEKTDVSLDRWDPLGDMVSLRDAMDRLLHESFVLPGGGSLFGSRQSLPLDIMEHDEQYTVSAWLPGVKPEDVQITVQGNTLTIRGETTATGTRTQGQTQPSGQTPAQGQGQRTGGQRGNNWVLHERRHGAFYRSVQLPTPVNVDRATTQFQNGELTITLPKAEEAKPKQIRITDGQQDQMGQARQIPQPQ